MLSLTRDGQHECMYMWLAPQAILQCLVIELASHGPVEAVQKIKAVISAIILFERSVRDETTMFVQHACLT